MDNYRVLIIIPAYNEEDAILGTFTQIMNYNEEHGTKYDVIVVNDCSTDSTEMICKENNIPTVSLVHNLGIGGAVQTGYKYAANHGYDIALQFDGDGQHNVSYVKDIIKPIINDEADFVIGSRFVTEDASEFKSSRARRMGIKIISTVIKIGTHKKIYDVTSGFRAANRKVILDFTRSYPVDYPEPITNTELLKKGCRIKEVPVAMKERAGGISSIRSWKSMYFMINVILAVIVASARRYTKNG